MRLLQQHGYYGVNYQLVGTEPTSLTELKNRLLNDRVRYTGWGPFWFPTRQEIAPRVIDDSTYMTAVEVHSKLKSGVLLLMAISR